MSKFNANPPNLNALLTTRAAQDQLQRLFAQAAAMAAAFLIPGSLAGAFFRWETA